MDTFYVPSITRNLISLSKLDVVGYSFKFENGCFSLFKHTFMIGSGTLYDGLYKLNLDNLYAETFMTLHHNVGTKCSLVDEQYAYLWHKRLGHISKERMQRLVNNEFLSDLDFIDLNVCVDCIKGKQKKHTKKGVTRMFCDRSQGLLGLSQNAYINKVLERLRMDKCSASPIPIQKGDKFSLMQCPKTDLEQKQMKNIPYAYVVGSLMYAQTCTRPYISFAVGMLGRYQSNPGLEHWKAAKKVLRYP